MPQSLVVSQQDAVLRLDGVYESDFVIGQNHFRLTAGLPRGNRHLSRRRHPLVILLTPGLLGSAIEMSRLLAGSREARACIIVQAEGTARDAGSLCALVDHCRRQFRADARETAVFVHGDIELLKVCCSGIPRVRRYIFGTSTAGDVALPAAVAGTRTLRVAWSVVSTSGVRQDDPRIHWKVLPEASEPSLATSAFIHGLRTFWSRDHRYGDEAVALAQPALARSLRLLSPLFQTIAPRKRAADMAGQGNVVRSAALGRNFEVFVARPDAERSPERVAAMIALDANAGFATVAETVARLTAAGEMEPTIVIGIGTPRAEGDIEFGYRRFEELSPPPAEHDQPEDALGRFFISFFALRGQDSKRQLGRAPGLWDFIVRELLPRLHAELPIDPAKLTLLGHSAAGTFVAFGIAQPDSPFSRYFCLSPGVAISGHWMLTDAALATPDGATVVADTPPQVFCALGSEELDNRFNQMAGIPQTHEYAQSLRARRGARVTYSVLEGETHTSVYPRALAQALRAMGKQSVDRKPMRRQARKS